ncbi:MAG: EI24 domain-containing protein [Bacteroidetes bacterium]|nr:EI24 domain-containing protein [Bacteroidota bacterium]
MDFRAGLSAFFEAFKFMRENKLMHYFLYPLLITAILWLGGITLMTEAVDSLKQLSTTYLQIPSQELDPDAGFWQNALETLKSWVNAGSTTLVSIIVAIAFFILLFLTTKYVMLALLSPALALLSERTEEILLGNSYPFALGQFLKDVGRGVLVSVRNLFMESGLLLLIWIITLFIPFIVPFTAFLSVLITSYYYGYSMLDYVHERRKIPMSEGAKEVRSMKGTAVALGIALTLSVQVPLIGFILAGSSAMVSAVAAVMLERPRSSYDSVPSITTRSINR